jgi:hypothetical protein
MGVVEFSLFVDPSSLSKFWTSETRCIEWNCDYNGSKVLVEVGIGRVHLSQRFSNDMCTHQVIERTISSDMK